MEERICQLCCLGAVEDEKHALLICPKYDKHRKLMFKTLFDLFPGLSSSDGDTLFKFLMKCDDWEVFKELSAMLENIVEIRGCL